MTISSDFLLAILSMDSYNRGYCQGVNLGSNSDAIGTMLGGAKIILRSSSDPKSAEYLSGFYAVAYQLPDNTIVISYRGTDNLRGTTANAGGADLYGGYSLGEGEANAPQALQEITATAYQFPD